MKRFFIKIISLFLHLGVIAVLAWFFWPFINRAIHVPKLTGSDAEQFIFLASYFQRFLSWPPVGWDHLMYEGIPRVLDSAFSHYYLIQPLVAELGLSLATKVYPLILLGLFFLFSYLVFFSLSRNHFIAFVLTAGLIASKSVYLQIYEFGVVLSSSAQMVFPLILFLLILFGQTASPRYLFLAALALAFQFYSHGAMALVFGFTSAIIFLFFCQFEKEKFLSWEKIRRLLSFTLITLTAGALAIFPQIFDSFKGGTYAKFPKTQVVAQPQIFQLLLENTNPALLVGLVLAVLTTILFFKKQRSNRLVLPLLALLAYLLIFHTTTVFGINPIGDLLFPGRTFWYFSFILAAIAAVLFSPLALKQKGFWWRFLGGVLASGVIGWFVLINPLEMDRILPLVKSEILPSKAERDEKLLSFYKTSLVGVWDKVDHQNENVRVWLHALPKIYWSIISPVPQAEGYFHYYTDYSTEWHAWFFATLAEETVDNKTIPQNMAEKQALFLIDWYGVKYLLPFPGPEFNLAPRFWQKNEYILEKSAQAPPAVLTLRPEFTSGIVEAVDVPLVGFVGSSEGYDAFLRDLGMLDLNTHYLIPLRLTSSINKLSQADLEKIDLLVLYNFKGGGGGWGKIADFVKKGGNLFIETGGNPSLREGTNLPEVLPAKQLEFGSLGKDWQIETSGELSIINFDQLEPLIYKGEPWKVSYVPDLGFVRKGSKVLISQAGKPVVVEHQLGQGKIVWSGLNTWYRPWEFKENGMIEVQLLETLLKKLLPTSYRPEIDVAISREKPEKIVVEGSNFTGVVFKDNHLPGWRASVGWQVEDGQWKEKKLPIYSAGPDLMFVSLPKDLKDKPIKVFFSYKGPWTYWLLFFISILSFVLVIGEIITNGFFSRKLRDFGLLKVFDPERFFKKIGSWWDKDEDKEY